MKQVASHVIKIGTVLLIYSLKIYASSNMNNQPVTIFCHGLGGKHGGEEKEYATHGFIQKPYTRVEFDSHLNLGQGRDIQALDDVVCGTNKDVILFAKSCGGSTALNYLGKHNPKNVKALILDSAPADMPEIVSDFQRKIGINLTPSRFIKECCLKTYFWGYPLNSKSPMQAIADIEDKNLLAFIAHSKEDTLVHCRSAYKNYHAFQQAGFKNVYLCLLDKGAHPSIAFGHDGQKYLNALASFNKQHNFKYNPKAEQIDLQIMQPSKQDISNILAADDQEYRRQTCRTMLPLVSLLFLASTYAK